MAGSRIQSNDDIRVGILGLGHVGLPTALGLAELGWRVVGADDDRGKVRELARGQMPIYEPGLEKALRRHQDTGQFRVVDSVAKAVTASTVLFVCVGTPQMEDGSADLGQVERVARTIARHLNGYKLVVEKSTAPARTAERIKHTIDRYAQGSHEFDVAVKGAEALLVLTEWPQFREVDLAKVRKRMTLPIIVDGRNFLEPQRARQLGFDYHGMGRYPGVWSQ